ncbi:MAG: PTS system fructose-specific EIIABC component [Phycisphaerae bacterium]|nr:PTS system fructose-specific EIIABC component [Phycisphaerae bacterium]
MKLAELVITDAVIPDLESTDRIGVIRELIHALANHGVFDPADEQKVFDSAVAREKQGSTGFGKGVAVPHVKHAAVKKMAATIGRSSKGVDFAALDRAPVYTVVLLLSPASEPEGHLAAMERIFRHLQRDNFRRFLRQADTKEAIGELIAEADETT